MKYRNDPRWIKAMQGCDCGYVDPKTGRRCPTWIDPGDRVFYYPGDGRRTGKCYGAKCGHGDDAAREFEAHRMDEDGF